MLTIEELEAKKNKLEAQLEEIDEQIEKAYNKKQLDDFNRLKNKYKDILIVCKKFYEAELEMYNLMQSVNDIKKTDCKNCDRDWDYDMKKKVCPLIPFCCWYCGDNEHPEEIIKEWFENILDKGE